MGVSPLRRNSDSSYRVAPPPPNPDPSNWVLMKHKEIGRFLIVQIRYPACTTYEGVKILVYEDVSISELLAQKKIDPHFSENETYKSPIARFVPLAKGWEMAQKLCKALDGNQNGL